MSDRLKHIFDESDCPTREALFSYMAGTLTRAERHRIEAHLVDCDFCSEAVEGYRDEENQGDIQTQLKDLEQRIHRQSSGLEKLGLPARRPYLKYAALLALVLLSLTTLFFLLSDNEHEELVVEAPVSRQAPSVEKQERKNQSAPEPAKAVKQQDALLPPPTSSDQMSAELDVNLESSSALKDLAAASTQDEQKGLAQKKKVSAESALSKTDAGAKEEVRETVSTPDSQELDAATTYSTNEIANVQKAPSSTGKSASTISVLDSAIRAYDKGYYIATINLLGTFSGTTNRESSKADWYLANAYVKTREYEKARPILERLGSGSSPYSRKSRKLLQDIQ